MDKDTTTKIKLGIFVMTGLAILIIGIYSIGNRQNLFSKNFRLHANFKQVNGLQPGNNVRFSGINVGTVEDISIMDDSTIRVVMVIKEQVQEFIKKDAIATIGSDGLMGNMLVNIDPGNSQKPTVEDGDMIVSYEKIKTDDIINTLNSSNENLALLIEELLAITQGVNRGKGAVGVLMKDSLLAQDLKVTLKNIHLTAANAASVTNEFHAMVDGWKKGEGLVNTLLMDTTYTGRIAHAVENIEKSTEELYQTSQQLNQLLEQKDQNAINTILRDSTFNADLQQSMEKVKTGTAKFDESMEALQHHWLLKGYFKKLEKEKGN
ncbi:MAG: MlaD family protein [Fulvivirga sp.]|uniref:MlaD family protein n=1 Tax=Fulvivirga sp. TaxID=1931237 RepID=UPI0032EF618B